MTAGNEKGEINTQSQETFMVRAPKGLAAQGNRDDWDIGLKYSKLQQQVTDKKLHLIPDSDTGWVHDIHRYPDRYPVKLDRHPIDTTGASDIRHLPHQGGDGVDLLHYLF
jgi:hypothetical protein